MANVISSLFMLWLRSLFNAISLHFSSPLRPTKMLSIDATARKNHYGCLIEGKFGSRDGRIRELQERGNDTGDKTAAQTAFYANSASFQCSVPPSCLWWIFTLHFNSLFVLLISLCKWGDAGVCIAHVEETLIYGTCMGSWIHHTPLLCVCV